MLNSMKQLKLRERRLFVYVDHTFSSLFSALGTVTEQFGAKVTGFDYHCPNFPN